MDSTIRPASRTFQLESHKLDNEFNKIINQSIDGLDISKVAEEVKLLAKLYLHKNLLSENATIGMKVYNLTLHDARHINVVDGTIQNDLGKYKFAFLGACNLFIPYLMNKLENTHSSGLQNYINQLKLPWLTLDNVVMVFKLLNVINFLAFLKTGRYLLLQNRLLGIITGLRDSQYYSNMSINKVHMELMGREMIWKALAEFLTTAMPYINLTKLKNQTLRTLGLASIMKSESNLSEKLLRKNYINKCAICNNQPFNPYAIGCRHVFCYYCLHSSYLSDKNAGYTCQSCKYSTKDKSQVQRYQIHDYSLLE